MSHTALAALLSTHDRAATVRERFLGNDLVTLTPRSSSEWESLIRLASAEVVLPALHACVTELNLGRHLPPEITDCLSAVTGLNRERNTEILSQLRDITAALNIAGIEPIVLKGLAYILNGAYSDPAVRYLLDIDLLIPSGQMSKAAEILHSLGYHSDPNHRLPALHHHLPAFHRPNSVCVELHHSIGIGICQKLLPAAELISNSSLISWNGVRLRIPSPDDLITHLVIHSQLLHPYFGRIWPPLRALYDLALLQRRLPTINWSFVAQRFQSQRLYATLALHLLQAEQSLGSPIPSSLSLSWFIRLRWARRQLLRRFPKLRYIDPRFVLSSTVSHRIRVLKSTLIAEGWRPVTKRLIQPAFYRRLTSEVEGLQAISTADYDVRQ